MLVWSTLCLIKLVSCFSTPTEYTEHEVRDTNVHRWTKGGRMPADFVVPVKISLTQNNLDEGHDLLMDISDPDSSNYAKYMSPDAIDDLFAPSNQSRESVLSWLESQNINKSQILITQNRQWLLFTSTISQLEALFHTEYYRYTSKATGKVGVACEKYSVPRTLQAVIEYIKPGIHPVLSLRPENGDTVSSNKKRAQKNPPQKWTSSPYGPHRTALGEKLAGCSSAVTPECYRLLYNVTDTLEFQEGNTLGIYENELSFLSPKDLRTFFDEFTHIPKHTFPQVDRIDGAPSPRAMKKYSHGEPDLDFEVAYPLVYPDKVILFQVDDLYWEGQLADHPHGKHNGEFNDFLDAIDGSYCNRTAFGITGNSRPDPIYPDPHKKAKGAYEGQLQCGRFKPANVFSISYGFDEEDYPVNYARRQCSEYMKLALQGVTIAIATGDFGVFPQEGHHCEGPNHKAFGPPDSVTCPYILGVGGTRLPPGGIPGVTREQASTITDSTGGFSNIYPRPAYQEKSLSYFFKHYPPPYKYYKTKYQAQPTEKGRYNRAGRGYPDISAIAQDVSIVENGRVTKGAGTSAAAPLVSALLARINNARKAVGKAPVGFVNQVLYKHPEILNDVVRGNNPGCGTKGFEAAPGWDPVTGLGTPNYGRMKDFFLSLP